MDADTTRKSDEVKLIIETEAHGDESDICLALSTIEDAITDDEEESGIVRCHGSNGLVIVSWRLAKNQPADA